MMPDLPNVGVERDLESFKEFFESPAFRADGLKIYPTLVIRGTGLYELWKTGRWDISMNILNLVMLVTWYMLWIFPNNSIMCVISMYLCTWFRFYFLGIHFTVIELEPYIQLNKSLTLTGIYVESLCFLVQCTNWLYFISLGLVFAYWLLGSYISFMFPFRYRNYPPELLVDIVARILSMVPPWTRVYRVQRDIPMPLVTSGVEKGNLRELALARMEDLGLKCRDVRTREAGIQVFSC